MAKKPNQDLKTERTLREIFREAAKRPQELPYLLRALEEDVKKVKDRKILRSMVSSALNEVASMSEKATRDVLTGILNRRAFEANLDSQTQDFQTTGTPFSLLILDIDKFKSFNDTYGHDTGDDVLKAVAGSLENTVKVNSNNGEGLVFRLGGEEMVALLPATNIEDAQTMAEKMREKVEQLKLFHRETGERLPTITVSVGAAEMARGEWGELLLGRADSALYQAKNNGRNQVVVAVPFKDRQSMPKINPPG